MKEKPENETSDLKLGDIITDASKIAESGIAAIQFQSLAIPSKKSPKMLVDYAIDKSNPNVSKLIFHFKNMALSDMAELGRVVYDYVAKTNIETAFAEAGPSPIFRNQWDFIFFNVPKMKAPLIQAEILQVVLKLFERTL